MHIQRASWNPKNALSLAQLPDCMSSNFVKYWKISVSHLCRFKTQMNCTICLSYRTNLIWNMPLCFVLIVSVKRKSDLTSKNCSSGKHKSTASRHSLGPFPNILEVMRMAVVPSRRQRNSLHSITSYQISRIFFTPQRPPYCCGWKN